MSVRVKILFSSGLSFKLRIIHVVAVWVMVRAKVGLWEIFGLGRELDSRPNSIPNPNPTTLAS